MNTTKKSTVLDFAIICFLIACCALPAQAGWSVNVGVNGSGTVTVKVTSATGQSNVVKTAFTSFPSATINKQSNFVFKATGSLPAGANSGTYVQVRATNNYKTTIESQTVGGDLNDSDELVGFVIPKTACASGNVEVVPIQITSNSVTFHYSAKLSDEGSAVLLRVIDALTGQQRHLILLTGPLDNTSDNCEGTFTVIGNPGQLSLLVDGHTSTLPFSIACPPDMVLGCTAPVLDTYNPPAVATGDTGPFTVTYDPLPNQLVYGVTNTVTATAMDTNGCTVSCQFKVYRQPITFTGFFSPIGGADATGGTCEVPLRTLKLGAVVPVKFAMSCGGVPLTTGQPTIQIQNCTGSTPPFVGNFVSFNNEWHFNIDSSVIGVPGKYVITAKLPDGSEHSAVVQYKR